MKKILCILAVLLILTVCLPALAEESVWAFDYNDYKLTEYMGGEGEVVIPGSIDSCSVDILGGYLFNGNETITSLTLPSSLKQVEDSAIAFCGNLTELIIPEGVQIIGDNCFISNPGLTEITIPASVRYIGANSFGSNESLKKVTFMGKCPILAGAAFDWLAEGAEIYVPDDQYEAYAAALSEAECTAAVLPSGANAVVIDHATDPSLFDFDAATGTITRFNGFDVCVEIPASIHDVPVKAIGEYAFAEHRYLCCLTLPEGLETIGASAFEGCNTLVHIDFPSTLKDIGSRAFYAGYKGYGLELPAVETIGDEAFAWCIRISNPIELPEGLRTIGNNAFGDCSWLSEVYLPASVEAIGERAFAGTALNYLVFEGQALPEMAPNTLEDCAYLADIDLHTKASKQEMLDLQASVDALGLSCRVWRTQNPDVDYVNDGLDVYENGVLTAYTGTQSHLRPWDTYDDVSVTGIGSGVFKDNQTIEYFSVPYNDLFTTIGAEAFAGSSVRTVDLFDSVTTIEDGAFRDCANLEELILPESVTHVGSGALGGCTGLKKLTVLCDPSILPGNLLEGCAAEMEIYAGENATEDQLKYLSSIAGRAWNNPVTRIGEPLPEVQAMPYAPLPGADFWYDPDFARLDRYNGYERNLILPREIDGVQLTMLGADAMGRAFCGDNYEMELPVVSVVIPETYTEIAPYAFANCETLETVVCYAPIELLPDYAFQNCTSLRELIFVNGVHGIGAYAFDNCPNLNTVYIGQYAENIHESAFLDENNESLWSLASCITDPALLPNVDALLSSVKLDPMPTPEPAATPEPAMPVGEEGAAFFGTWHGVEMDMGGKLMKLSDLDMVMTLLLCEDGRMLISDSDTIDASLAEEGDWLNWRVENGTAISKEGSMTITEDGRLCIEEDELMLYFIREGAANESATEAFVPAAQNDAFEVKYVCVNADVNGYTVDASMLGGTYSLVFHENGAADFVVAGAPLPGILWEKADSDNLLLDYYGTKMEVVWTEAGFDMNYFDTMLLHFSAEA